MGFWDRYRASLKSKEVEEPVDRWLHRPLGYIVARLLERTPVSPDAVTILSGIVGLVGAVCLFLPFRFHHQVGGLLLVASAVFDCADGQLARIRGTSSSWGRILDGFVDLVVTLAAAVASLWIILFTNKDSVTKIVLLFLMMPVVLVTSWYHTVIYDIFKGFWQRFTDPKFNPEEAETAEQARARWEKLRRELPFVRRSLWKVYLFYTIKQAELWRWFGLHLLPLRPFDPHTAAIFRRHMAHPWAVIRNLCGLGSLLFGLALFNAVEQLTLYMLIRLVVINGIVLAYVIPAARRGARAASEEMARLAA